MSVVLYTGLPGAGKSYGAVEHVVVPALKAGRVVVTNLPLKVELLAELGGEVRALPEAPEGWADIPGGAVVVVDEAWRIWPAGVPAQKIPEAYREFLAMHRHRVDESGNCQQVVVITQRAEGVARFVRDLVEQRVNVVKLSAVGADRRYRVDIYEGTELDEKHRIRQIFGQYSQDVYRLYQSHTAAVDQGVAVNEKKVDGRGSVWSSSMVRLGLPVAGVLLLFGGALMADFFSPGAEIVEPGREAARAASGVTNTGRPPAEGSANRVPVTNERWRLGGWVKNADGRVVLALLVDADGRERQIAGSGCFVEGKEVVCEVDGQKVYSWSGAKRGVLGVGGPL